MSVKEARPLFDAYVRTTGIDLTPSATRIAACEELVRRKMTEADVVAVIERIKQHIRKGMPGYVEASLEWRNVMLKADTFEERALKLRQEAARKPKPRKLVSQSRTLPDGRTETVQVPETEREPQVADPAAALRNLADEIGRRKG